MQNIAVYSNLNEGKTKNNSSYQNEDKHQLQRYSIIIYTQYKGISDYG